MKFTARFLKLFPAALLAAAAGAGYARAAAGPRFSKFFLQYNAALASTSTVRTTQALSAAGASSGTLTPKRALGWRPSPLSMAHFAGQDVSGAITGGRVGVASTGIRTTYTSAYDLRNSGGVNYLTPVRNQGNYGTCWSFATYGSLESSLMPGEPRDFSENNIAMNSGFDSTDPMNSGGNSSMAAAYLARWTGPVNETDDPYPSFPAEVTRTGLPVQKHTQELYWLPPTAAHYDTTFINNVKAAITSHIAVYSSIYWDDNALASDGHSYYDTTCAYPYGHTDSGGNEDDGCTCQTSGCGGHAIAIVGWDDTYAASNFRTPPAGPGAFLVRNSWGSGWGLSGYFYLSYYDTSIGNESALFSVNAATTNYNAVYQYDPLGFTYEIGNADLTGTDSYTEWMANIFTASAAGYLKAAGFYTTDVNVSYSLYVYTGVSAGSPASGTLAYSASGSIPMSGYHTIVFGGSVPVSSGQKFSVVVKLTNPSSNNFPYPIPVEYPIPNYSSGASASSGQSYVSNDGSSWTDLTSVTSSYYGDNFYKTNVCLKAYAYTDATAPANIAAVNDGLGPDISVTGSTTALSANWTPSSDPESGVAAYYYAIGASAGDTSVTGGWINNGLSQAVTRTGLSLVTGHTYYFGVKAQNGVGLFSGVTWSNGQTVNITFPSDIPYIYDGTGTDIGYVSSLNTLSANWGAATFSGGSIDHYYYAIGKTPGAADVAVWTDLGPNRYNVTKTGLALTEGQTYYFSVKAENNLANYSNPTISNGQTVDLTSPTVAIAMGSTVNNGPFSATLNITEAGVIASTPSVSFVAPDGELVPLEVSRQSGLTWQATGFIESYYSTGTATLRFSAVDGAGNTGTSITSGNSFLIDQSVSGVSGGTVANSDGVKVTIPAGAYAGNLYVEISTVSPALTDAADLASPDSIKIRSTDLVRQFSARDTAGTPVTVLLSTITMSYPDADGDGYIDGDFIKESLAWLYYLDESSGKWTPLTGVIRNPAANTVSAPASHFSLYSVRALAGTSGGLSDLKAYPNPCDFRKAPALYISGVPPDAVNPRVYIYNEAGELVRTLAPGSGIDGTNLAAWNGRLPAGSKAASGLYIYFVKTDNYGKGKGKFFLVW